MDSLSAGFLLFIARQVSYYCGDLDKSIVQSLAANLTDKLLSRGAKSALKILRSRNAEQPGNHDLLKSLRRSMLQATQEVRKSMKDEAQDDQFRSKLKSWLSRQLAKIEDINAWHNWENPAIDELELFFGGSADYAERQRALVDRMVSSWQGYLEEQTDLIPIADSFSYKLLNGWMDHGKRIFWADLVMLNFKIYVRSAETSESQQAGKALTHNFLSELKLELADLGDEIRQFGPMLEDMGDYLKNDFPAQILEIDNALGAIERLTQNNSILTEMAKSQQDTISYLTELLIGKERELANLAIFKHQLEVEGQRYNVVQLNEEIQQLRQKLNEIYELYPARYQLLLDGQKLTRSLEERSAEGDMRREMRKQMELQENIADAGIKYELSLKLTETYRYSDAIKLIDEAMLLCPGINKFLLHKASVYTHVGAIRQAAELMGQLNGDNPYSEDTTEFEYLTNLYRIRSQLNLWNGDYDDAEQNLKYALSFHIEQFGDTDGKYLHYLYEEIATAFFLNGKFENGVICLKRAVNLTIDKFGLCSEEFCGAILNVAYLHYRAEHYSRALELLLWAHDKAKLLQLPDSPVTLEILALIGDIFMRLGELEKSLQFNSFALKISGDVFGGYGNHQINANILQAEILYKLGRIEDAEKYYEIVEAQHQSVRPADGENEDLIYHYHDVATMYFTSGIFNKAAVEFEKVVPYYRREGLLGISIFFSSLVYLSVAYFYEGRYLEFLDLFKEAETIIIEQGKGNKVLDSLKDYVDISERMTSVERL